MNHDPWLPRLEGLEGRLGLFGGSFDPVHTAHVEVARTARIARDLEKVVFLPAALNPHKPGGARAFDVDRLAMLRLALAEEEGLFVSPLELERAGTSYTVDTLEELHLRLAPKAQLFFVMGSDCLPAFPRWRCVERVLELAEIVVVEREGFAKSDLTRLSPAMEEAQIDQLRRGFVERETLPASSSGIRDHLDANRSATGLDLHPAVAAYVRERGLYR